MGDEPKKPIDRTRHLAAVALVIAGASILVGLLIAVVFRQSFGDVPPPFEDMASGLIVLSPIVIFALLLIGYGRSLLRKE